jgi:two-component system, LytTR family, sensor kinase
MMPGSYQKNSSARHALNEISGRSQCLEMRARPAASILHFVNRRTTKGLLVFAFFTAAGLLLFGYRYLEALATRQNVSPLPVLIDQVVTGSWMAAALFPLIARFARRYPIDRLNWITRVPLHLCAVMSYSGVHTSLMWATRSLIYPLLGLERYDYGILRIRYPMEFSLDVIAYSVIVSILYLLDHRVRAAQLEGKLAQVQLENLRLQLQPHFLFNTLNAISTVVYEDPRKADAMIARLAALLRSTLLNSQLVPLDQEIETLELYLHIMRLRFENELQVKVCLAPDVHKALAPHFLLQPLVENAIRHGKDPTSHAVAIQITAERDGSDTRVRVRDWGRGLPKHGIRRGTGISNTAERLRKLYGSRHRLEFENCDDAGLLVTVVFPYQT